MFNRILLLLAVLVGLAGCDSNEPTQVLEIIADRDTLEFHNEFGVWVTASEWFQSADGTPVNVTVESDHESILWLLESEASTGQLKARVPTLAPIRIVGSAPGHREASVDVMARAYGECPMSIAGDDYLPLDSTLVTTFDYDRRSETRVSRNRRVGTLTVGVESVSCEDETRTVTWNRSFAGIEISSYRYSESPPDTTQVALELRSMRTVETRDHRVSIWYPAEVYNEIVVDRYLDLGGASQILDSYREKVELAPNVGIVSISFDAYLGSGSAWYETWTRQ